jgi:DAK2 domain fusion protein YloV
VVRASDGTIDGRVLADGLAAAAEGAYGAVMRPVEGTILTVVRETAEAAAAAVAAGADLLGVLEAARVGGYASLERTPELLSVLADAGVVDAGGAGFVLLIDAALLVVDGRPLPEPPEVDELAEAIAVAHGDGHGEGGIADLRYEVMYFLEAPDETIPWFKDVWAGIGDSIVVVGGDGIWNCHIHTDDIGASIEAALDCGRPRNIRITDLLEQVEEEKWVREGSGGAPDEESPLALTPASTAVVAVSVGDGIRRIFHSLGVQQIVSGGQSMNPSTKQLLEAVEACPSDCVVILPNNKNIIPVAEQVGAHTSKTVRVVPTRGISEGFAALVAYDPEADIEANAAALTESAEAVTAGEITRAVRDSSCDLGPIAEGDWLGISREGIDAVEKTLADAATTLLDKLIDDSHEIITLIEGEGSSVGDTRRITQWLADNHPDITAEVHSGGQPLYPYFIGIE